MTLSNEERDEIRALVLRAFYDAHEAAPGRPIRIDQIAQHIERDQAEIARAVQYLADRQLLEITNQQHSLSSTIPSIHSHITANGIDVIERPEQKGAGILDPAVIHQITVINGTQISGGTVYQNSQHVAGANHGVMVNASHTGDITPPATPFPLEQLRAMLPIGTPEREAVETLAEESHSLTPRLSRITTAMETVKATAISAEAVKAVVEWFQAPDVAHWFQHLMTLMMSAT